MLTIPLLLEDGGGPLLLEDIPGPLLLDNIFEVILVIGYRQGSIAGPNASIAEIIHDEVTPTPPFGLEFDFSNLLALGETITRVIKIRIASEPSVSAANSAVIGGFGVPLARVGVHVVQEPQGRLLCVVGTSFARRIKMEVVTDPSDPILSIPFLEMA